MTIYRLRRWLARDVGPRRDGTMNKRQGRLPVSRTPPRADAAGCRRSRAGHGMEWLAACTLGAAMILSGWTAGAAEGVGAQFDLTASARSLGVGGARAAFRDDAAAATLNPSSLAWVEGMQLATLYVSQFGGVSYGAAAFSAPFVGVAASLVDSGWIASGDSGLRFAAQGAEVAAGIPVGPAAFGARWRFLRTGAPFEGRGWALDAGLLIELGSVRVGAIGEAIVSSPMAYDGGLRESWNADLCVGAALTLATSREVIWTIVADVDGILAGSWRVVGGIEMWADSVAARLGWDGGGPTLGLSVRVSGIEVDWSYAVRSDLGGSHRVSLEVLF